ncbi:hypothetical protein ACFL3D_02520 [Candidatus Omnitrophota bacterium]
MFNKRSFTLIETVAALFVMGIVIISGITLMQFGARLSLFNKERSVALFLLERKLEEISSVPSNESVAGSNTFIEAQFDDYRFTVVEWIGIGQVPTGLEDYLKKVAVTVAWPEGDLKHSVEIETYIAHTP